MKNISYREFSLQTHQKNWRAGRPNVCQFELTFRCPLRCKHCYCSCYNNGRDVARELGAKEIKLVLDKIRRAGVIWLCMTGGDPLIRDDFLELYAYAKRKGFIVTVFTSGASVTAEVADYFAEHPPLAIELTVNAVTKELYEYITQTEGSYERVKRGVSLLTDRRLPVKIKMQVTKENIAEWPRVRAWAEELGFRFSTSAILYPRLNGDKTPCSLRITPKMFLSLCDVPQTECDDDRFEKKTAQTDPVTVSAGEAARTVGDGRGAVASGARQPLFHCAVGSGDGFHVDPYGRMFLCSLIRDPSYDIVSGSVAPGLSELNRFFRDRAIGERHRCFDCSLRAACRHCPGIAYLENGDAESHVAYFCEVARLVSESAKEKEPVSSRRNG
ncbi:MAG: radical SAM protein [Candidatus Omnitrophica bacterium]|nr:radical SAM protein [Candidatus Omnitrophota bacterium]